MLTSPTPHSQNLSRGFSPGQIWLGAAIVPIFLTPLWVTGTVVRPLSGPTGLVLTLLLLTSTLTDLRARKIYNWTTYTAFAYAVGINTFLEPTSARTIGISECLLGAATCFLLMLIPYTMARGGAGDVKLATAIGSLCGVGDGVLTIAFAYIIAGVAILSWTIWTTGPVTLMSALVRRCAATLCPGRVAMPTEDQSLLLEKPIPLAGFFAAGTLCVVFDVPAFLRSL